MRYVWTRIFSKTKNVSEYVWTRPLFSLQKFSWCCFQFVLGLTIVLREIENIAYVEFWTENKEYYRFLSKDYFTYLSNEPVVNAFVSTRILISQIIRESFTCDGQR